MKCVTVTEMADLTELFPHGIRQSEPYKHTSCLSWLMLPEKNRKDCFLRATEQPCSIWIAKTCDQFGVIEYPQLKIIDDTCKDNKRLLYCTENEEVV